MREMGSSSMLQVGNNMMHGNLMGRGHKDLEIWMKRCRHLRRMLVNKFQPQGFNLRYSQAHGNKLSQRRSQADRDVDVQQEHSRDRQSKITNQRVSTLMNPKYKNQNRVR